ncbi:YhcN/YlaJ family sporulation lipoprotein [Bacillus gobiensis]|uniref:YhcN/YlaJ family sporulation lipoprotein n=1 Tax=Bacillus gobiensis TaxID=1441095 RepID=UPI003D23E81F
MEHKFFKLTGLVFSLTALSACGAQDNGLNNAYDNGTQRVGYYSNDANNNRDGMDNQGPFAELIDGMTNGGARNVDERTGNIREQPIGVNDNRGEYSRGDMNYHNHIMNTGDGGEKKENKELSGKITDELNRKNNIDNAAVLVTDATIFVSVRTDEALTQARKNQIEQIVSKYADNRTVQINNDAGTFTRMRNINGDNASSR